MIEVITLGMCVLNSQDLSKLDRHQFCCSMCIYHLHRKIRVHCNHLGNTRTHLQ